MTENCYHSEYFYGNREVCFSRANGHKIALIFRNQLRQPGCFSSEQISYQSIESSDPGINVPGPRRTVSKLRNETYHMFSNLHPGTTYLISVRARTAKGFGQTALTEITTNISGIHAALSLAQSRAGKQGERIINRLQLRSDAARTLGPPCTTVYLGSGFFSRFHLFLLTLAELFLPSVRAISIASLHGDTLSTCSPPDIN